MRAIHHWRHRVWLLVAGLCLALLPGAAAVRGYPGERLGDAAVAAAGLPVRQDDRAAGPGAPVILVDNSSRGWDVLPYPWGRLDAPTSQNLPAGPALVPRSLFSLLREAGYDVTTRLPWGDLESWPAGALPIQAGELAGVDLLVLPWRDCPQLSVQAAAEEVQTLTAWVQGGGRLLVFASPRPDRCQELPLLGALGVGLGKGSALAHGEAAQGELERSYSLVLYDAAPLKHGGRTLIRWRDRPVAALLELGQGQAAVIASGDWLYHRARGDPIGGPIPFLESDNLSFLLDLCAHLAGGGGELDRARAAWGCRLDDLGLALFWTGLNGIDRPLHRLPGAPGRPLLTPQTRRGLLAARDKLDQAGDLRLEAQQALDRGDYATVERRYDQAVAVGRQARDLIRTAHRWPWLVVGLVVVLVALLVTASMVLGRRRT